jgi:hypothetical protein
VLTDFVESPVATHAAQEFLMSIDPPKQEALAAYVLSSFLHVLFTFFLNIHF